MRLKQYYSRKCALALAILMLLDAIHPAVMLALTSGPSQPEVQGFKPIEATNMVDLFTGDFNYNLPLFEIDGYPLNMSYNSNARMEDEASWVGLGWTLNPGAVSREVRGFPDDFKDEKIEKKFNIKNDVTIGVRSGFDVELFGIKALRGGIGREFFWNNKKGYGTKTSASISGSIAFLNASANAAYGSQSGLDFGGGLGLNIGVKMINVGINAGTNINSRQGLKTIDFGLSIKAAGIKSDIYSSGAQLDFVGFTYFPTNPMPMLNFSSTFHGRLGFELNGFHPAANLDGYVVIQGLATKSQAQNAFGYLYNNEGQKDVRNLLDCNKDGQPVYRENTPNLPVSYGTYDNFSIAGQGIGGQFRLHKNDIGVLHTSYNQNTSAAGKFGAEIGILPNIKHGGADVAVTLVSTTSKEWSDNNKIKNVISFTDHDSLYERAYFKDGSEKTVDDDDFITKIGGTDPAFVNLSKDKTTPIAERNLEIQRNKYKIGGSAISTITKKTPRGKRGSVMSYLTRAEADVFGLDKQIKSYTANTLYYTPNTCPTPTIIPQTSQYSKPHHIREVNITKPDGSRYVFGLPAYNIRQKEVSFSVNQNTPIIDGQAYVSYAAADTTTANTNGRDNLLDNQTIPAHAHSYLLTGVLSDDYVDVKNDGISNDDLGNAVKFNYTKQANTYKWRTPYAKDKARLMQGMKTDKMDDKASYVFGEKEIWYVHSIESRNMVAQFYVSDLTGANKRLDAFGVEGEGGGKDSVNQGLRKLEYVRIYSKSDLLKNGANAIPIKQINFEYDYTLCQKAFSSTFVGGNLQGKLTLKKVYFTFGNNGKGKLNAYKFTYKTKSTTTNVPLDYDSTRIDRWGFLKQHPAGYPTYSDFPYTVQDSTNATQYSGAWNIDSIYLPSGGRINVQYESDDYAYVQNKRAGQMFIIKGFAPDTTVASFTVGSPNAASLYTPSTPLPFGSPTNNRFIVIDAAAYSSLLNSASSPINEVRKLFFEDVDKLYFKVKVQLTRDTTTKEYVTGYADCNQSLVHYNGVTKNIFIPITSLSDGGISMNPITLAALQTLRLNLPDIAYDYAGQSESVNNPTKASMRKALTGLLGFAQSMSDLIKGYNKTRIKQQWARTVDVNNSWVRLANPTYKKFGGGSRVKQISVFDDWTIANGGGETSYIQNFNYTTVNSDGKRISSGVASYEPMVGGDEISLKQPLPYKDKKVLLAPDNSYYSETPIGESFYPGAGVGYSEVRVESVYPNVKRSGTGYSVNQFYTAKDFPTITDFTNLSSGTVKVKSNPFLKFLKLDVIDQRGASQGFAIETNDMHGKAKQEVIYNQQGAQISATNYRYKVDDEAATVQHLNNDVQVVDPAGAITTRKMGITTDIWEDMQDELTETKTVGAAVNVEGFVLFTIPIIAPIILPIFQNERRGLKTAVTTKHIHRMGMLDRVTKTVDGSTLTTNNVLYDQETSDVLLTKTENEFNDPIYNFSYPAHWAYDGMGSAYKNIGGLFKGIQFSSNGQFTSITNAKDYFVGGDELILTNESNNITKDSLYHVVQYSPTSLRVFGPSGFPLDGTTGTYTVKIKRSGRRNKSAMPIGSIASLANPVVGDSVKISSTTKVFQAEAKEYKDLWQMKCADKITVIKGRVTTYSFQSEIINPYLKGLYGNWRGLRNFVHYNQRNVTNLSTPSNIRTDGIIPNFAPYWEYNATTRLWGSNFSNNWVRSDSVHLYDLRGNEIESSDANNIPSAAYYGYNGTQVVAVTSNSTYKEATFDSFEDYEFKNDCSPLANFVNKNIKFYDSAYRTNNYRLCDTAHTGKYALFIGAGSNGFTQALISGEYCSPTTIPLPINVPVANNAGSAPNPTTAGMPIPVAALAVGNGTTLSSNCADCLPDFFPIRNKRYTFSAWVASDSSLSCNAKPTNMSIKVNADGGITVIEVQPQGPVIDGWQKVEGSFAVAAYAVKMQVIFSNSSTTIGGFVDDVRILPFNAKMKSYVYDWRSRRLMAEMDENHYATFYEYDDEGILVRIKRETETGIQTVKEARNYLKPNNPQ
jgi:hypothetical protein